MQSAGDVQRAIADAYRKKAGLITGPEIRSLREARGLTQTQLAEMMNIGIASIKRWETGMVQTKSMDQALRMQLQCSIRSDNYTGNREISLPRIKLVAKAFERILGRRLLKAGDRFLFLAKYLWYADILAFWQLGQGLTGASYAAITYGPQLNKYRDLMKPLLPLNSRPGRAFAGATVGAVRSPARPDQPCLSSRTATPAWGTGGR